MCHMIYRKVSELTCVLQLEVSYELESCNELGVMAGARTFSATGPEAGRSQGQGPVRPPDKTWS